MSINDIPDPPIQRFTSAWADGHAAPALTNHDTTRITTPNTRSYLTRGFAAAVASAVIIVAGLAGCSKNTSSTGAPPNSNATSATAPGSTTRSSAQPSEMTWQTDDVTAVTGAPPAAFLLPTSYVSEAQGTQHLIYLGFADNHIHELWRENAGWHTDDLTAATGAPPPSGALVGYVFGAQGTQHVFYVGASDTHIHELWRENAGWHTDDLTAATGAPPPGGGSLVAYAFEAQGTQHVIYQDANYSNRHIRELWSDPTGWHTDDLTAATGAPPPGSGSLVGYAFEAQGTQHVFYQDATPRDVHIHELWSDPTGWHTDDLTAATGAPPANIGDLAGYVFEPQGTQHVIYTAGLGAEDHIHELWWDNNGRHTDDLTTATGAPPGGGGSMVAYAFEAQGSQHLFYINYPNQHVHELSWDNNGRHSDDLTAATGAPPVSSGGGPPGSLGLTGYAFEAQGTQHVFYVNYPDNHIHELWWGPTASAQQPASSASSTAPSANVTASSTPGNTSGPNGSTANGSFVGNWHVHGATLDIAQTTATVVVSHGPCTSGVQITCSETDTLAVVSGDDRQLTLVVTAVRYTGNTGATVPPNPGPSTVVGDSIQLVWQAPGLLKQTVLRGFPGSAGGNPYWCGAGISQINIQLCGA
jgi:hypothetical protein